MVVAGVLMDSEKSDTLKELGVKDSKDVPRDHRIELRRKIKELIDEKFVYIFEPADLEENLTKIEVDAFIKMIDAAKPSEVFIDAPVPPAAIPALVGNLRNQCAHKNLKFTVENKADAKYAVVSAASILAKVARDQAIKALHKQYGDFGWGYPSEPKTQNFLRSYYLENQAFPDCVRTRWATIQRIIYEIKAPRLSF
jgi:ribonuclease HII